MQRSHFAAAITVFLVLSLSCSGLSGDPLAPGSNRLAPVSERTISNAAGSQLWGLWEVVWNAETRSFDSMPLRSAEFACNVIRFVNGPPPNLIIHIADIDPQPTYIRFSVDVGLCHPFPGLDCFTGFDVMGVFMGDGSGMYPGPEGFPIPGPGDQRLLNPDGYTRWFNAPEFAGAGDIMPIQGYYPGSRGTPGYTPTSVLNPYKYYADGLDPQADAFNFLMANPDSRGAFRPGSTNYRRFIVEFPSNPAGIRFQYAVVANWEVNIHHPDPPTGLDDFPISANSQEALLVDIEDSSTAYYGGPTTYGGDIVLDITPWDWSASAIGLMEEYSIKAYSDAWTGPFFVDMLPIAQGNHFCTFHASIPVESLTSPDSLPVWIEIAYPGYDYTSPKGVPNDADGTLASYFLTEAFVLDQTTQTGNFVYGLGDWDIFYKGSEPDNDKLLANLITMPAGGPYSDNQIVMYYEGHSNGHVCPDVFQAIAVNLGYTFQYVVDTPDGPVLDTTGVRTLVISTFYPKDEPDYFSPQEIQAIKDLVNGGGVCAILIDWPGSHPNTASLDKLLMDLGVDFSCPNDMTEETNYTTTDITDDPITQGVNVINGWWWGRFEVTGDAVSIVRSQGGQTIVCKSPIS